MAFVRSTRLQTAEPASALPGLSSSAAVSAAFSDVTTAHASDGECDESCDDAPARRITMLGMPGSSREMRKISTSGGAGAGGDMTHDSSSHSMHAHSPPVSEPLLLPSHVQLQSMATAAAPPPLTANGFASTKRDWRLFEQGMRFGAMLMVRGSPDRMQSRRVGRSFLAQ